MISSSGNYMKDIVMLTVKELIEHIIDEEGLTGAYRILDYFSDKAFKESKSIQIHDKCKEKWNLLYEKVTDLIKEAWF